MAINRQYLKHVILYEFHTQVSVAGANRNINLVYPNSTGVCIVQDWSKNLKLEFLISVINPAVVFQM